MEHLFQHSELVSISQAYEISCQILNAVAGLHNLNIVHGDIHPGNILITQDGIVKLSDFSASQNVDSDIDQKETNYFTFEYSAPEVLGHSDKRFLCKKSDLWSVGCVIFNLFTGKQPFECESLSQQLDNIYQAKINWQYWPMDETANKMKIIVEQLCCLSIEDRLSAENALFFLNTPN